MFTVLLNTLRHLLSAVDCTCLEHLFSKLKLDERTWKLVQQNPAVIQDTVQKQVQQLDDAVQDFIVRLRSKAVQCNFKLPLANLHDSNFTQEVNVAYRVLSRAIEVRSSVFHHIKPVLSKVDSFLDEISGAQLPTLDIKKFYKNFQGTADVVPALGSVQLGSVAKVVQAADEKKKEVSAVDDEEEASKEFFDGSGVRELKTINRRARVGLKQTPPDQQSKPKPKLQKLADEVSEQSLDTEDDAKSDFQPTAPDDEFMERYLQFRAKGLEIVLEIVDNYALCILAQIVSLAIAELLEKDADFGASLNYGVSVCGHFIRTALPLIERATRLEPSFMSENVFGLSMRGIAKGTIHKLPRQVVRKFRVLSDLFKSLDCFVFPRTIYAHHGGVKCIALSHVASNCVATAGYDRVVRIWNLNTGECLAQLVGHKSIVTWCSFANVDHWVVSASFDATVNVWNAKTGLLQRTLTGHEDSILCCDLSRNQKNLLTASMDCTVRLWSLETGSCLRVYRGHKHWVKAVRYSADEKALISASLDNVIILWDLRQPLAKGQNTTPALRMLRLHEDYVLDMTVFGSGNTSGMVSCGKDQTIRLWDVAHARQRTVLRHAEVNALSLAISPNEALLAAAFFDNSIRIYDLASVELLREIQVQNDGLLCVTFVDNKTLVCGTSDGKVQLIEL